MKRKKKANLYSDPHHPTQLKKKTYLTRVLRLLNKGDHFVYFNLRSTAMRPNYNGAPKIKLPIDAYCFKK